MAGVTTQPLAAADAGAAPMPAAWPLWRRWLLKFGSLYLALYFLIGGQPLLGSGLDDARFAVATALHRLLFGSALLPHMGGGSGDTSFDWAFTLLVLLVSLMGGTLWTALERSRTPHLIHLELLSQGLRVALFFWLTLYGMTKFNFGQFGLLSSGQLTATYGESSPMGLLWRFMAASPGYQLVAGVAETLPALLLLHRRTVTLGALIAAVTLTNVLALNLFYDVPVKLFSAHLLLASLVLLAGDHARLGAFLRGRAVPAQAFGARPGLSAATAWVLTVLLLTGVGWQVWGGVKVLRADRAQDSAAPLKTRGFHPVSEQPFNR